MSIAKLSPKSARVAELLTAIVLFEGVEMAKACLAQALEDAAKTRSLLSHRLPRTPGGHHLFSQLPD